MAMVLTCHGIGRDFTFATRGLFGAVIESEASIFGMSNRPEPSATHKAAPQDTATLRRTSRRETETAQISR